jgi:hypothetical protein
MQGLGQCAGRIPFVQLIRLCYEQATRVHQRVIRIIVGRQMFLIVVVVMVLHIVHKLLYSV